jgi:hypothetical protein
MGGMEPWKDVMWSCDHMGMNMFPLPLVKLRFGINSWGSFSLFHAIPYLKNIGTK